MSVKILCLEAWQLPEPGWKPNPLLYHQLTNKSLRCQWRFRTLQSRTEPSPGLLDTSSQISRYATGSFSAHKPTSTPWVAFQLTNRALHHWWFALPPQLRNEHRTAAQNTSSQSITLYTGAVCRYVKEDLKWKTITGPIRTNGVKCRDLQQFFCGFLVWFVKSGHLKVWKTRQLVLPFWPCPWHHECFRQVWQLCVFYREPTFSCCSLAKRELTWLYLNMLKSEEKKTKKIHMLDKYW